MGGGNRRGGIYTSAGAPTIAGSTLSPAQSAAPGQPGDQGSGHSFSTGSSLVSNPTDQQSAAGQQVIRLKSSGSSMTLAGGGTTRLIQLGVSIPEGPLATASTVGPKRLDSPHTSLL